jgi:hypothetical protein
MSWNSLECLVFWCVMLGERHTAKAPSPPSINIVSRGSLCSTSQHLRILHHLLWLHRSPSAQVWLYTCAMDHAYRPRIAHFDRDDLWLKPLIDGGCQERSTYRQRIPAAATSGSVTKVSRQRLFQDRRHLRALNEVLAIIVRISLQRQL